MANYNSGGHGMTAIHITGVYRQGWLCVSVLTRFSEMRFTPLETMLGVIFPWHTRWLLPRSRSDSTDLWVLWSFR
jgi:hypothetical protein